MDYELYHHGVKGQKWGIRRFQPYPKGERVKGGKEIGIAKRVKQKDKIPKSVSKASKKIEAVVARRQAKSAAKEEKQIRKEQAVIDKKEEPVRKKLSEMSEEELQSEIKKMQLQKQYSDLFKSLYPQPQPVNKGKNAVKKLFGDIMTSAVKDVGTQTMKYVLGSIINSASGKKVVKLGGDDNKKKKKDD